MKSNDESKKSSATDMIEGDAKIVSGKIKEGTGRVLRSPDLRDKGITEEGKGHVQKKIGEIKKVFAE